MTEWNSTHADWLYGTRDVHMAKLETEATIMNIGGYFQLDSTSICDVGAGSAYWSKKIFPNAERCDRIGSTEVLEANILSLPYKDGEFELVHARRVLSNLDTQPEREHGFNELCRISSKYVLVLDVFEEEHNRVNAIRQQAKLRPLPSPHMGRGPLTRRTFGDRSHFRETPIGASYYLWTRAYLPIMLGREVDYDETDLRESHPKFTGRAEGKYGVHRLFIFKV
jgi:hypothetical protein